MTKKLLLASLCTSTLLGYNVGDKIDTDVANQLNIKSDKVYVIDFFASWCKSCKIELPLISKLNNKLDDKYEIKGVCIDEEKEIGKAFVKKLDLEFNVIYDESNKLVSKFSPIGVPAIYYIKNNEIAKVVFGAVDDIDEKIKHDLSLLEK